MTVDFGIEAITVVAAVVDMAVADMVVVVDMAVVVVMVAADMVDAVDTSLLRKVHE